MGFMPKFIKWLNLIMTIDPIWGGKWDRGFGWIIFHFNLSYLLHSEHFQCRVFGASFAVCWILVCCFWIFHLLVFRIIHSNYAKISIKILHSLNELLLGCSKILMFQQCYSNPDIIVTLRSRKNRWYSSWFRRRCYAGSNPKGWTILYYFNNYI